MLWRHEPAPDIGADMPWALAAAVTLMPLGGALILLRGAVRRTR